jgi:cell division protein FtsB
MAPAAATAPTKAGAKSKSKSTSTSTTTRKPNPRSLEPSGGARARHPVLFGVWVTLVVVVALALILFLVLPTRTWLGQRSGLSDASRRLELLTEENDALAARAASLENAAEIERLARQQYGMIRPGEDAYSVLPAAAPDQLPASWPYNVLQGILAARAAEVSGVTPTTTVAPAATVVPPPVG